MSQPSHRSRWSDPEAQRIYDAEDRSITEMPLRRFACHAEIVEFIEWVMTSSWWDATFPTAPVQVEVRRRSSGATFSAAAVSDDEVALIVLIDRVGWGLETVIHELAHVAVGIRHGHGPVFETALLQLWRHLAGIEAWSVLQRQLSRSDGPRVAERPDVSPPRGPRP